MRRFVGPFLLVLIFLLAMINNVLAQTVGYEEVVKSAKNTLSTLRLDPLLQGDQCTARIRHYMGVQLELTVPAEAIGSTYEEFRALIVKTGRDLVYVDSRILNSDQEFRPVVCGSGASSIYIATLLEVAFEIHNIVSSWNTEERQEMSGDSMVYNAPTAIGSWFLTEKGKRELPALIKCWREGERTDNVCWIRLITMIRSWSLSPDQIGLTEKEAGMVLNGKFSGKDLPVSISRK